MADDGRIDHAASAETQSLEAWVDLPDGVLHGQQGPQVLGLGDNALLGFREPFYLMDLLDRFHRPSDGKPLRVVHPEFREH